MAAPQEFHVEVVDDGPVVRARLVGSLDGETVAEMLAVVGPLADVATGIVLDCGGLGFCDSSGLRGFALLRKRLDGRGSLALEAPSANLRQILAITGMDDLVTDGAGPPS